MDFWNQFHPGFTVLAPMEGVTDIAFRQVVARAARPEIFYTEFTNVNSYTSEKGRHNDGETEHLIIPCRRYDNPSCKRIHRMLPTDSSTPVKTNIPERKTKNKYGGAEVCKIRQN